MIEHLTLGVGHMTTNDVSALQANFATWQADRMPGFTGVDPFEYYCVDQFLKAFAVSDEELRTGLVGGGNDGGADAAYFFVNRKLVQEDTDLDPKTAVKVNIVIMQVKQNQGFSPNEINKLIFFSDDLLDLSRQPPYRTTYNEKVMEVMRVFKKSIRKSRVPFLMCSLTTTISLKLMKLRTKMRKPLAIDRCSPIFDHFFPRIR